MAYDVFFSRIHKSNRVWIIGETNKGRKWMNLMFGSSNPQYISYDEVDRYVSSAKERDLQVEVV